jgi:hypothetical protein
LYRGVVVWNRSRKRDNYREIKQHPRPAEDEIRAVRPELRIVTEDLWVRVASRRADTEGRAIRFEGGRISGRPPKYAVQNLLAGLATCGVCGGGLVVETSARKRGRVSEYVCHRHRYGRCPNGLRIALADMNEAVLQSIEEHALTPEAVEQVVALSERDELRERQDALRALQQDMERRIARLIDVLATGAGDVASVVAKLRDLELRKTAITRELEQLLPVPRLAPAVIENRLAEWRRLLRQSVTQVRALLQRVLQGRITFTPVCRGYEFSAPTRFDKLFARVAGPRPSFIAPGDVTGTEDITPADTPDVDYGLLLERACGNAHKGCTSPTGFEEGRRLEPTTFVIGVAA